MLEVKVGAGTSLDTVRPCSSITVGVSVRQDQTEVEEGRVEHTWTLHKDDVPLSNVPPHVCAVLEDVLLDAAVGSEVTVVDEIAGVHLKLTVKHADQKGLLRALMTADTHAHLAKRFKGNGVILFKNQQTYWAARSFSKCIQHLVLFKELHQLPLEGELGPLYDAAYSNLAECHLRLGRPFVYACAPAKRHAFHTMASVCCDKVLEVDADDPVHTKARFRKAKAERINGQPDVSIELLTRILQKDPGNKAAQQELQRAEADMARQRRREAAMYAGMFAAKPDTPKHAADKQEEVGGGRVVDSRPSAREQGTGADGADGADGDGGDKEGEVQHASS
ncbi:hypothetical protein PTSG_06684 [Salpingoeca rosetta]|uniref:BDBT FKBP like N-terminal domain-containing protein n=1 Tax=Salpingoeca rosetta (strain ATCC 50818 / BSB-021) TaxID=946362 RepID=F2UFP9_SALR5|nr:uncharacterized protein PTSG_06684 [Salpingoeca rosetta]EGD75617.1 hypothetical protein PTSG_06684 [Salpingoeca rosetta]|eukprot:XP_004992074.1 hypothetical protein PTSG_06684 [Salpingoeca rosetta]